MGKYVGGFVVPVPKDNLDAYRQMVEEARGAYQRALSLTQQQWEQQFLERRLAELGK
ncbi:DUF1428 family protein [Halomonas sp. GXIMD04776]|uniref:DUF1428 family protein n=1 Tax=Halomonas sp. GXIMD04776 TaxID=3415605 RepID=UPI003CBC0EDF